MNESMNDSQSLDDILSQHHGQRQAVVEVDAPPIKLVIFALGAAWFAFYGSHVREILPDTPVHFVPGCPPALEGVINVRGDIQTVIRLQLLLQLPAPAAASTSTAQGSAIILGRAGALDSGLRVDSVVDVVDIPASHLQPPPSNLADPLRPWVLGVLQFQDHPVTVLDVERLLTDYFQGLG